jgi:hypothetical protein
LQVGLFKIQNRERFPGRWAFLIDIKKTIAFPKCLVILGVNLDRLEEKKDFEGSFSPSLEDAELIDLVPLSSSSGQIIYEAIEKKALQFDYIAQIIGDGGSDIQKAMRLFCEQHQETIAIYDITHKLSCLLRAELKFDCIWQEICQHIGRTKQKIKQTNLSFLMPPAKKEKVRLFYVNELVKWLDRMRNLPTIEGKDQYPCLRWILDYQDDLKDLQQMIEVAVQTLQFVKQEGLNRNILFDLKKQWLGMNLGKRAYFFSLKIENYLKEQILPIGNQEIVLGSTDVLDSLLAKYKHIENRCVVTKSLTKNVLTIGILVGKINRNLIKRALECIPIKAIQDWIDENLGQSDLSKRKLIWQKAKIEPDSLGKMFAI